MQLVPEISGEKVLAARGMLRSDLRLATAISMALAVQFVPGDAIVCLVADRPIKVTLHQNTTSTQTAAERKSKKLGAGKSSMIESAAKAAAAKAIPATLRSKIRMSKLIYLMQTSLDGYVEDEHGSIGWSAPDDDLNSYINERTSSYGTYLYGRKMYESMVYWETEYAAHDLPQYLSDWARQWQAAEKIVYSKTLVESCSARTRIERDFDPEAVRLFKAEAESDITVSGANLAAHAINAGLVDEFQMYVCPVVLGAGKRFFPNEVRSELTLIEERKFRNGVVVLRYAV